MLFVNLVKFLVVNAFGKNCVNNFPKDYVFMYICTYDTNQPQLKCMPLVNPEGLHVTHFAFCSSHVKS